ncbi:hypothetical protein HK096_008729 [Nowakowskiella sp. JEL0078]|nr:hypothetical protein HK096_008729 [Nowakowskiella sp. JEL0078]
MSFTYPPRGISRQPIQSLQQTTQLPPKEEPPQEKESDWIAGIFSNWSQKPEQKKPTERSNSNPSSPPPDNVSHFSTDTSKTSIFDVTYPTSPKQDSKTRSGFFRDQNETKQPNSPPQNFASTARKISIVPQQSFPEQLTQSNISINKIFSKKSPTTDKIPQFFEFNETRDKFDLEAVSKIEPTSPLQIYTSNQSASQSNVSQYNSFNSRETHRSYVSFEAFQDSQLQTPSLIRINAIDSNQKSALDNQIWQSSNSLEITSKEYKIIKKNRDQSPSEQINDQETDQNFESYILEHYSSAVYIYIKIFENTPLDIDNNSLEGIEFLLLEKTMTHQDRTEAELNSMKSPIPAQQQNIQNEVENYQYVVFLNYSQHSDVVQENPIPEYRNNEKKTYFSGNELPLAKRYSYENIHEEPSPMILSKSHYEPVIILSDAHENEIHSSKSFEIHGKSPSVSKTYSFQIVEISENHSFPSVESQPKRNTLTVDALGKSNKLIKTKPNIPQRGHSIEKVSAILPEIQKTGNFQAAVTNFPSVTQDPFTEKRIDPTKCSGEGPSKPQINVHYILENQEKPLEELHKESKERVLILRQNRKEVQEHNESLGNDIKKEEQQINEFLQTFGMNQLTFTVPFDELEENMIKATKNAEAITQQWEIAACDYYPFVKNNIALLINGVIENTDLEEEDTMYANLDYDAVEYAKHQVDTELERVSRELVEKAAIVQIRGKLIKNLQSQLTSDSTDRIINERMAEYQTSDWEHRLPGHNIFQKVRDETELEAHEIALKLDALKSEGVTVEQNIEVLQMKYDQMLKMKKRFIKRHKKLVKDVEPLLEGSVKAITMVFGMVMKAHLELTEAKNVLDNIHKDQELFQHQYDEY